MGFKKNLTNKANKLKNKVGKLLDKANPTFKRALFFIKNNKGFVVMITVTSVVGSSSFISLTLPEFAKILSESTLISIASKEYRKSEALSILKQLKEGELFTTCNFESLVRDLDLSDITKVRKFYVYLGSIENIGNIDMQNHLVICIVLTLVRLYFSNCSNFNSIIEGLLNALKRGYLSKRIFELIMAMLRKRGVPVQDILAMLESQ